MAITAGTRLGPFEIAAQIGVGAMSHSTARSRQPSTGQTNQCLFITVREGVYRLQMLAQGPERLGK